MRAFPCAVLAILTVVDARTEALDTVESLLSFNTILSLVSWWLSCQIGALTFRATELLFELLRFTLQVAENASSLLAVHLAAGADSECSDTSTAS